MNDRDRLEALKWLKPQDRALIKRLAYVSIKTNSSPLLNQHNVDTRNLIFNEIISGNVPAEKLNDFLDTSLSEDVVIAEIDRYGLPLRTVINIGTGLIRTDPYYSRDWLHRFYDRYYRDLYSNQKTVSWASILTEQISRGGRYYELIKRDLKGHERILEIGCGMGGILIPFKINGHEVRGIDLDERFVRVGNKLSLNLTTGDIDHILSNGDKFDLVILSHIVEHIPNIALFFEKLKKVLHKDGLIFIAVPGVKYIDHTYKRNVQLYLQNAHCWSFTKATLDQSLRKFSFTPLYIDEEINCLARVSDYVAFQKGLGDEFSNVINYLQRTEKQFLTEKSILRRGIKKISSINPFKIYEVQSSKSNC